MLVGILVSVLLVLTPVRLLMTNMFLTLEYTRPGFPQDPYGFTQEDRLRYAPAAIQYLVTPDDISILQQLTFPDGTPLFNDRELRHMIDVKHVVDTAFLIYGMGGLVFLVTSAAALFSVAIRKQLLRGIFYGGMMTMAGFAALVVFAVTQWNTFFARFHQIFFEDGTWLFQYSDTLIRLFPEQFWFDAALVIGSLAILLALACILGANALLKRYPK